MENQNKTTEGHVISKGKLLYTEIRINAPAEKIWAIFTDFKNYSKWNPFVRTLTGQVSPGNNIAVTLQAPGKKPMDFQPQVLSFDKEKEFRWIGKFILPRLFDGEHTFKLRDNGDGSCTFIQYERFRGLLVPFLKTMLDINTKAGFEQMNAALKKRCEAL